MTSTPSNVNPQAVTNVMDSLSRVINDSMQISMGVLESFGNMLQSSMRTAPNQLMRRTQRAMGAMQNVGLGCSCHIPPPCWLPQPAGEVLSHVCPGGTAVLSLCVTNRSFTKRTITIEAPANSGITITPSSVTLGPLERGCVSLSVTAPASAPSATSTSCAEEKQNVIFVKGCKTHYLLWIVAVSPRGACTCHEVCVEDCEDFLHHWYDHFYCRRGCPNPAGAV
jgi:hypothetical protein